MGKHFTVHPFPNVFTKSRLKSRRCKQVFVCPFPFVSVPWAFCNSQLQGIFRHLFSNNSPQSYRYQQVQKGEYPKASFSITAQVPKMFFHLAFALAVFPKEFRTTQLML